MTLSPPADPEFTGLPLRELADAALAQAKSLGAQHADFRAERIRGQQIGLSDGNPQTLFDADDTGLAVRVIVDGTWGFASTVDLTADAAAHGHPAAGPAVPAGHRHRGLRRRQVRHHADAGPAGGPGP